MKPFADLHSHTIGSLHGLSTLYENKVKAGEQGMYFLACTDHLYYHEDDILRKNEIARFLECSNVRTAAGDVNIIPGIETNLHQKIDTNTAKRIESKVKWRLVGAHSWYLNPDKTYVGSLPGFYKDAVIYVSNDDTRRLRPETEIRPTAFAHIQRNMMSYVGSTDMHYVIETLRNIVDIAVDNNIFLEINNSDLVRNQKTDIELMKIWVAYAKTKHALFCLGTDAHYCEAVGDFRLTEEFLETMDMEHEYILNCDYSALKAFLTTT